MPLERLSHRRIRFLFNCPVSSPYITLIQITEHRFQVYRSAHRSRFFSNA